MTPTAKHPSKEQAAQVASALLDLVAQFEAQGDTAAAVTLAAEQARTAAQTESPAQRSQLLAAALVNITPRALKVDGASYNRKSRRVVSPS